MTKITNSVSERVTIRKAEGSLTAAEIIAAIGEYLEDNNLPCQLAIFKDMHDESIWLYTDESVA